MNKGTAIVVKAILENLILVHGPIRVLLMDQGTEYVNEIFRELWKNLNVDHQTTAPYHHQTLGSMEKNHRFFNEYIRSYIKSANEWEPYLQYIYYCYGTTFHASFDHRYSPFELVFSRRANRIESFFLKLTA